MLRPRLVVSSVCLVRTRIWPRGGSTNRGRCRGEATKLQRTAGVLEELAGEVLRGSLEREAYRDVLVCPFGAVSLPSSSPSSSLVALLGFGCFGALLGLAAADSSGSLSPRFCDKAVKLLTTAECISVRSLVLEFFLL